MYVPLPSLSLSSLPSFPIPLSFSHSPPKIDEAIASLEGGDYGFCEACGIEIGIRRLEARPTATLCYDCKVLDEIREKQMG